ncbi:MAG TPA: hypothetical protein VFK10_03215 [Burkholderiaceae bacterium]|nr:hypothetical protein [Burkholderiaceae bacterium]
MMRNAQRNWLTLTLCASIAAAPAWAAGIAGDNAVPPTASNERPAATIDPATAPAPQTYGGVEVINGGADSDQANAIKRMAPQYKLRVELSGRGGQYEVADDLKLVQRDEVIADIPDAGPWVLLNVPPGRYTLQGQFGEQRMQRDVTVAAGGTTVHWVLPATID